MYYSTQKLQSLSIDELLVSIRSCTREVDSLAHHDPHDALAYLTTIQSLTDEVANRIHDYLDDN